MIKGVVNEVIWESMDDFDDMVGMSMDDMTKVDVDVEDDQQLASRTAKLRVNRLNV